MPTLTAQTHSLLAGGFCFLKNVFSETELSAARQGQKDLMAGQINLAPNFKWPTPRARQCRSVKTPYASHFRTELATLSRSHNFLSQIAEATEAKTLRLWFDQLLWEEPTEKSPPLNYHWHTERSRWKTCQSHLMVTAWVPLASLTPAMGPITMIRGSAQRKWLELPDGWQPKASEILPAPVQLGDAALFCWHTIHGNPPNLGHSPRRAIAFHYAVNELCYRRHGKFSHLNERVVAQQNAIPDFTDEDVCPLVWRKS